MRRLLVLVLLVGAAVATAAVLRGADPLDARSAGDARDVARAVERTARSAGRRLRGAAGAARERVDGAAAIRLPRCPADVAGCAAVRGRVVLVEAVDPDGDGDLHVVIADGSVTAPGFTAVDVRPGLRPRRDPRVGDLAAAAGPVQPGSLGQSQIHALAFRTARGG